MNAGAGLGVQGAQVAGQTAFCRFNEVRLTACTAWQKFIQTGHQTHKSFANFLLATARQLGENSRLYHGRVDPITRKTL
ncbi:MAG: hypothetical protein ACWA6Y_07495 [Polaromonas sp.]